MSETENAKIRSARIVIERGCLTIEIGCEGQGWSQMFGGYRLGSEDIRDNARGYMAAWVAGLMAVFDVEDFGKLVGQPCRVRRDEGRCGMITEIGHFLREKWFRPRDAESAVDFHFLADDEG